MHLRDERLADHPGVEQVIVDAFGNDGRKVAALAGELRASVVDGRGLSLVAEHEALIVGHVMFSPCLLELAHKYTGQPYAWYGGRKQTRLIVSIEADRITSVP